MYTWPRPSADLVLPVRAPGYGQEHVAPRAGHAARPVAAGVPPACEGQGGRRTQVLLVRRGRATRRRGRVRPALPSDWDGILLEHVLFHEIQSYLHYRGSKGTLGYWRTPSGSEVDFVWSRGKRVVAIEAKAAREFRPAFKMGLDSFSEGVRVASYIVYRGDRELRVDDTWVLPVERFLRRLHAGEIIPE